MRRSLVTLAVLLASVSAHAELLKVTDLYKKSEVLLKESTAAKTEKERIAKFKDLEKAIESTRATYELKESDQDSDAYEAISRFFYTLSPIVKLVDEKKIAAKCDFTENRIKSADAQGKDEGAPLTKDATVALEWLKQFCK